ncbi:SH3 domain-containing protein [Psychroserpens sp. NJDZ02]|uniref:SH3 domain-containing protein n=1 Tax=Psychroserpens sp. NJDZ02 TaxID=2570561 RepID=UPI0010A7E69F|nr:SH3 domain-containing protein [Psychroserpens sp. NJDZ02]QCE43382.1 SH3 domain-containing protein [Psychroserpens sp. NJDZ02]
MKKIITCSIFIFLLSSCKQDTNNENKLNSLVSKGDTKIVKKSNNHLSVNKCSSSVLRVYLNDPDKSGTNIRKTPKGKIITKLIVDELNHDYFITLTESKDGWFKIKSPIYGMETDIKIPNSEGWIHGSVISVDTRNYGNQHLKLLETPNNGKVITIIKEEVIELRLKDICGDWTKIQYNKYVGWIENKWLCGNPLTNCN